MIIDGRMQILPAFSTLFSGARVALANPITCDPMVDALDPPRLLDIDMDHLARRTPLVTDDLRFGIEA